MTDNIKFVTPKNGVDRQSLAGCVSLIVRVLWCSVSQILYIDEL